MTKAEALQGSIDKWRAIVAGTGADLGTGNCPLCKEFLSGCHDKGRCYGCPVMEKTGRTNCAGSPYDAWEEHDAHYPDYLTIQCPTCLKLAQAELDFLLSLQE